MREEFKPEQSIEEKFSELRIMAHAQAKHDLEERIKTNPIPTEEESNLGLFKERLEPQVRDVLLDLHAKGYHTMSSGFNPYEPTKQSISFYNDVQLPEQAKKSIESLGAKVAAVPFRGEEGYYWQIEFIAETADLEALKLMWNKIGQLIPPTGHKPWRSTMADKFEKEFPTR